MPTRQAEFGECWFCLRPIIQCWGLLLTHYWGGDIALIPKHSVEGRPNGSRDGTWASCKALCSSPLSSVLAQEMG